jgi:cyclohexyl-isocyanide hydratase
MTRPDNKTINMNTTPVKNVVFILFDKVTLMDFVGATEVFNNTPGMVIHWLAPTMDAITTSENMKVLPTGTFDKPLPGSDDPLTEVEILFIPGGNYGGVGPAMFDERYRSFIQQTAAIAQWSGSVCTGGFIAAAAGLLNSCEVTTYWSQVPNLSLLKDKCQFTVAHGYPRFLLDEANRRFTGGGISSSVDLALALVEKITDTPTAEKAQLFIQYAPGPPVQAGDPSQAPPLIIEEVMEMQAGYTGEIYEAVQRLLREG